MLQTKAGDRSARALGPVDDAELRGHFYNDVLIECEMGVPRLKPPPAALKRGLRLGAKTYKPVCVDVGNPHAVVFAMPKSETELSTWGRALETHKAFPKRTNAEFARVRDKHVIEVKVWERGAGITEACGTGAVASAVAAIAAGLCESPVEVRFPGGQAEVRWDGAGRPAYLRGHAHEVFSAVWLSE